MRLLSYDDSATEWNLPWAVLKGRFDFIIANVENIFHRYVVQSGRSMLNANIETIVVSS